MPNAPLTRTNIAAARPALPDCIRLVRDVDPTTVTTPVVSYARISDDGEDDEHGVRNQHRRNGLNAARLGWTVVAEITDNDITATKAELVRDGFEVMVHGLKTDKLPDGTRFVGVVTAAEDRMCRRAGDYERLVDVFIARPGHVFADHRGKLDLYSETVEGMGLVGVVFSKMEARKTSRRLRDFHRDRIMDGKPPTGGNRPFGWQDDRATAHPVEAPLLAAAARDHLAGRSLNSIVREWQRGGVKTTTGREWTTTSLKRAFQNPRMCGWRRLNGEIVTDDSGKPYVGSWDALIEPEEWEALDGLFQSRKGKVVGRYGVIGDAPADFLTRKHLLTGLAICGKPREDGTICGSKLRVGRYPYDYSRHLYQCMPKSLGGCAGTARNGRFVDEHITEAALAKLEERAAMKVASAPWNRQTELDDYEAMFAALREQWRDRRISNEFYFADAQHLQDKIAELRKDRARHEVGAKRASLDVDNIRERWFTTDPSKNPLDLSQKRAYLQLALHAVIVHPTPRNGRGRAALNPDLLEPVWRESYAA